MTNDNIFRDFIGDYRLDRKKGISVVSARDLLQLKSEGFSVEDLLNYLSEHYQSLLHGSRLEILDDKLKQNKDGEIFGSNLAGIALMRAIISNRGLQHPGLQYPYFIGEDHPLEVRIHGINDGTIGDKGFVYVLNQIEGFRNNPQGSWQYIRKGQDVPIVAKIEVVRHDFIYPIFDVTNGRRWNL